MIDNTVLNTALPTLARVLHAGTSTLQWIVDAYTLCFAALLIAAGLWATASVAPHPRGRPGGVRSVQPGRDLRPGQRAADRRPGGDGLGAALVMPSTLSILTSVFPAEERPQAIGAWSAVVGVGVVIGPSLGGLLLAHFWWGSVFLVNVPLVAVLALVGVAWTVPESADGQIGTPGPGRRRPDRRRALVALVDAIIEAPGRGWGSRPRWGSPWPVSAALAGFVIWELRSEHPLIDLRVFTFAGFHATAGAVTIIFFSLFGSLFALTQYLQLVLGYSPLSAGVRALPFALAMGALSPVSTVLARRVGSRQVVSRVASCSWPVAWPPSRAWARARATRCSPPSSRSWGRAWDWSWRRPAPPSWPSPRPARPGRGAR